MKKNPGLSYMAIAFFVVCSVVACSKGSNGGDNPDVNQSATDEFKKKMLVNYADNIIIPAYTTLQTSVSLLESKIEAFVSNPSSTTQDALRADFKNAYLSFEKVSVSNFGPATTSSILLSNAINTFPSVKTKIEAGIQSGSYNFNQSPLSDSIQGFPALDYLLFATDAVQKFTSGNNVAARSKYVKDVLANMKLLLANTISQWKATYRDYFVSSLKTNVGSSIGNLVNQFAFEMDALKGPRIGWPFGKQSNGTVFADKCEGYHSGLSKQLAIANLTSLKNYYTGGSAEGIDDYLVLLKKDQLNTQVLTQFDVTLAALNAIPETLAQSFTSNAPAVEAAYKEIQKLLTLLKTDVASATAVQITYMDNDGD